MRGASSITRSSSRSAGKTRWTIGLSPRRLCAMAIISVGAYWIVGYALPGTPPICADAMLRAGQIMEQAIAAVRLQREAAGGIDLRIDPNRTGLIGPESSPLMTTVGELESKRTTTNPNIAGAIVLLLWQAGVRPGDSIAIGGSGSFPALLVASLAAARALETHPVTILSLGASSFGATDPEFTLLDLYALLRRARICDSPPAAVSIGGEQDVGLDFDPEARERLEKSIEAAGIPYLHESDLRKNASERMQIYSRGAQGRIAAFINSGGGYANLGTSPLILEARPGLQAGLRLPPPPERGVLFDMSARGIPVIHLLFIKGLAMQAGLPWDPIPLPGAGLQQSAGGDPSAAFQAVATMYFALLTLIAAWRR